MRFCLIINTYPFCFKWYLLSLLIILKRDKIISSLLCFMCRDGKQTFVCTFFHQTLNFHKCALRCLRYGAADSLFWCVRKRPTPLRTCMHLREWEKKRLSLTLSRRANSSASLGARTPHMENLFLKFMSTIEIENSIMLTQVERIFSTHLFC
jgi:hypothetical protein